MNDNNLNTTQPADTTVTTSVALEQHNQRFRSFLALVGAGVLACLLASSCTFVDESEWVLVERLGQVVRILDEPEQRGLQWKWPWPIESTRTFDARVQIHDPPGGEMVTADKKNITVDAFLCWRIADARDEDGTGVSSKTDSWQTRPVYRFFTTLGETRTAHARLAEHVLPALRTRLGETDFDALVNVDDSEDGPTPDRVGQLVSIPQAVRSELADLTRRRYGIELIDVRIKRLNFPQQNQVAVYERMKTERRKIAEQYRSDGLAENTKIKSRADLQYSQILANAKREAEQIKSQADAESLSMLNQAHQRDVEFYRFTRTLDSYRQILNDRTTLVLSGASPLLKLLTQGLPEARPGDTDPQPTTSTDSKSADNKSPIPGPSPQSTRAPAGKGKP